MRFAPDFRFHLKERGALTEGLTWIQGTQIEVSVASLQYWVQLGWSRNGTWKVGGRRTNHGGMIWSIAAQPGVFGGKSPGGGDLSDGSVILLTTGVVRGHLES